MASIFRILVFVFLLIFASQGFGKSKVKTRDTDIMFQNELRVSSPTPARVNYYGGPVINSIKPVIVYWTDKVNPNTIKKMKQFVQALLAGPTLAWIGDEYSTSETKIGAGNLVEEYTIAPALTSTLIQDSDVQNELNYQISKNYLPQADANTVYLLYFPKDYTVVDSDQANSCTYGGFCGYHSSVVFKGQVGNNHLYYSVFPDMDTDHCSDGCGTGSALERLMSVTSHEVFEVVTDPQITEATDFASPLAWYDPNYGEVGDICNQQTMSFTGFDGQIYSVQKEFSNRFNSCIGSPISSFNLSSSAVLGSSKVNGQINLAANTTKIETVSITSSNPNIVAPANVIIPKGKKIGAVILSTSPVSQATSVVLTASLGSVSVSQVIIVQPPQLSSLVLPNPSIIKRGGNLTGTATISGPAPKGGVLISLTGSANSSVIVPASVTVPEGAVRAQFLVKVTSQSPLGRATISGSLRGIAKSATLTVVK
jgi:hypothetical protein